MERAKIEKNVAKLMKLVEQSSKGKTLEERDRADAEGRDIMIDFAIDIMMMLNDMGRDIKRIADSLDES